MSKFAFFAFLNFLQLVSPALAKCNICFYLPENTSIAIQSGRLTTKKVDQSASEEPNHPILATASIWFAIAAIALLACFWFSGILLPEFLYLSIHLASTGSLFHFFSKKSVEKSPERWRVRRIRIGKVFNLSALCLILVSLLALIASSLFSGD